MKTKDLNKQTRREADAIIRKRYYLKGDQVSVFRDTFEYNLVLLGLQLNALWKAIKSFFGYCPKCGTKLFTWSYGVYKCDKCKKTYYS